MIITATIAVFLSSFFAYHIGHSAGSTLTVKIVVKAMGAASDEIKDWPADASKAGMAAFELLSSTLKKMAKG